MPQTPELEQFVDSAHSLLARLRKSEPFLPGEMPVGVRGLMVQPPRPPLDCDVIFSSLPGDVAREAEGCFAAAGFPVISNSSSYRMDVTSLMVTGTGGTGRAPGYC